MNAKSFLSSLNEELLAPEEFADVEGVSSTLKELEEAIAAFKKITSEEDFDKFFTVDESDTLMAILLGTSPRWLHEGKNLERAKRQLLSWRKWSHGGSLKAIATGLLLAQAQRSRGRRRRKKFLSIVQERLLHAVNISSENLHLASSYRLAAGAATRKYDFVVFNGFEALVAVVSIFQTTSGGRQQDIFRGLPDLQDTLIDNGVTLLVVADGPGFRTMAGVVEEIAPSLDNLVNLGSFTSDYLSDLFDQAIALHRGQTKRESRSFTARARIAELALKAGRKVTPELLDISPPRMENFILQFTATHENYALSTNELGILFAKDADAVRRSSEIFDQIRSGSIQGSLDLVRILSDKLGYRFIDTNGESRLVSSGLDVRGAQLRLPKPLPVFVLRGPTERRTADQLEEVDRRLSRGSNIARIAIVIDPASSKESERLAASFKKNNRSQLAILDEDGFIRLLLLNRDAARRRFLHTITSQIDLIIISPFISEGPTPENMFFGRELEIRRIVEQHMSQSFAIIGGRKSGKTSLLQRLRELIPNKSPVCYIDCQAHPDRADFLDFLRAKTQSDGRGERNVSLSRAESILRSFIASEFGNRSGVMLLDEVDELFLADSTAETYPHVLSKALRAISQSSLSTIVATGERSLFELTRDPSSPHWNFCSPIRIGPLESDASRRLILEPLRELGVDVAASAVDLVLKRTAQHPNLLQYLGTKIVERLAPESRTGEILTVDEKLVEDIADSPDYRHRFIVTFFSQSTPLEKLIALELSYAESVKPEKLRIGLMSSQVNVDPRSLSRSLAFLELYSIVNQTQDGFSFASEAFDYYFAPLSSGLMVEQWLEEIS
jgi:hypothetical protein